MSDPTAPMALLDLAARYGLVNATTRAQFQAQLRSAVTAGAPTSLARILIREGQGPEVMAAILASGELASAVVCDACGQARLQSELPGRSEVPCLHCGSLIMGFRAFTKPPTRRLAATTRRYQEVLPLPDPNDQTSPYGVILPTPGRQPGTGAEEEAFDTLLNTVSAGPPTRVSATQAFGSAKEVVAQLAIDPSQAEGDPTVEEDARDKIRAELGVAAGAPIPLFGEATVPPPQGSPLHASPGAAPSPASAPRPPSPPRPPSSQPKRALWPLALIMLLLLGLSALGLFLLLGPEQ